MKASEVAIDKRSWISLWRSHPFIMGFAAVGLVAVVAFATTVLLNKAGLIRFDILDPLSDSDEAPIRVRNGSLELLIQPSQSWEQIQTSNSWWIAAAKRHRNAFHVEIKVANGGVCAGPLPASGSEIEFLYENDDDPTTLKTSRITLRAQGQRTVVDPGQVTMTWDSTPDNRAKLTYSNPEGYISKITIGPGINTTTCTFTAQNQLDSMIIRNLP
jgi:hypothetical protein